MGTTLLNFVIVGALTWSFYRSNKKADRGEIELEADEVRGCSPSPSGTMLTPTLGGLATRLPVHLLRAGLGRELAMLIL